MESKLIIFVVLASLAQCSLALSRSIAYGLSDEDSVNFTKIKHIQNKALEAKLAAARPFFDLIDKYVFVHISGLESGTDDDSRKIAEAKCNARKAIDYFLDAIQIAFGGSCSAVDVAREAAYVNIDKMYAAAEHAWNSAMGNYTANRAQIGLNQDAARKAFADLVQTVYDSFRTCLNTKDPGLLAAVEDSENGSGSALRQVVDTIFSAITIFASLNVIKTDNGLIISNMEGLRNLAYDASKSDVEFTFALTGTVYLNSKLENPKIWRALAANQHSRIASFGRWIEEGDTMLGTMMAALRRVYLGITVDGSSIDADQARAAAKISAGSQAYWQSINIAYSDAAELIAAATKASTNVLPNAMGVFYSAYRAAQNSSLSYQESLEAIDKADRTISETIVTFNEIRYNVIRDNRTLESSVEARVATLQNATLDAHATYVGGIFGAARILAKAFFSGTASKEDIAAVYAKRASVVSGLDDYSQTISTAGIIVLNALNH